MHPGCPFMEGFWDRLVDSLSQGSDDSFSMAVRFEQQNNPVCYDTTTQLRAGTATLASINFLLHHIEPGMVVRPHPAVVCGRPEPLDKDIIARAEARLKLLNDRLYLQLVESRLADDPNDENFRFNANKRLNMGVCLKQVLDAAGQALMMHNGFIAVGYEFCHFLYEGMRLGENTVFDWGIAMKEIRS